MTSGKTATSTLAALERKTRGPAVLAAPRGDAAHRGGAFRLVAPAERQDQAEPTGAPERRAATMPSMLEPASPKSM